MTDAYERKEVPMGGTTVQEIPDAANLVTLSLTPARSELDCTR
jgi:hypothetical protein